MDLRRLIKEAWHGRAVIHVGKQGVTESVLAEIKRQLEARKVVKVRLLKSCIEREGKTRRELARMIAEKVGARLVGIRGYAFVLCIDPRAKGGRARAGASA